MIKPFFNFFFSCPLGPDFWTSYCNNQQVKASLIKIIALESPSRAQIWAVLHKKNVKTDRSSKKFKKKTWPAGFFGVFRDFLEISLDLAEAILLRGRSLDLK